MIIDSQSNVEGCVQTYARIPRTKLKGDESTLSLTLVGMQKTFHPQTCLFLLYLPYVSQNEPIRELIVHCNFLEDGRHFKPGQL